MYPITKMGVSHAFELLFLFKIDKCIYQARTVPFHGALSPQSTGRHSSYRNIRSWPLETEARSDTSGGERFLVYSKLNLYKSVQLRSFKVSKQLFSYYVLCVSSLSQLYLADKWNWFKNSHKLSDLQNFNTYYPSYRHNSNHEICEGMGPNAFLFER